MTVIGKSLDGLRTAFDKIMPLLHCQSAMQQRISTEANGHVRKQRMHLHRSQWTTSLASIIPSTYLAMMVHPSSTSKLC